MAVSYNKALKSFPVQFVEFHWLWFSGAEAAAGTQAAAERSSDQTGSENHEIPAAAQSECNAFILCLRFC